VLLKISDLDGFKSNFRYSPDLSACVVHFYGVVVVINVRNDVCHVVIANTLTGI